MSQETKSEFQPVMGKALPPEAQPAANHGHTGASWVAMIIVMVAAVVSLCGFIFDINALAWAGLPVAIVGLIIGGVLRVLGYGQPRAGKTAA